MTLRGALPTIGHRTTRGWGAILCTLVALAAAGSPARAQSQPPQTQTGVAIALVLAVDASGSVDNRRFELQKQGYAA